MSLGDLLPRTIGGETNQPSGSHTAIIWKFQPRCRTRNFASFQRLWILHAWRCPGLPPPCHGGLCRGHGLNRKRAGGKLLVFSRFKAVPTALASLLSFNLEASFAHRLRRNYRLAGKAQPLQFKDDRPTLPALFFPSPTLIAFTDPRLKPVSSLGEVRCFHASARSAG